MIKPVVTEKSMKAVSRHCYTFKVDKKAAKSQIRKIVEEKFKVNVVKVRTINTKKKKGWKKALVEIKKGQKIKGFGEKDEKKEK